MFSHNYVVGNYKSQGNFKMDSLTKARLEAERAVRMEARVEETKRRLKADFEQPMHGNTYSSSEFTVRPEKVMYIDYKKISSGVSELPGTTIYIRNPVTKNKAEFKLFDKESSATVPAKLEYFYETTDDTSRTFPQLKGWIVVICV